MLTVGSLFAGYGGIELALSSVLDVRPAWFVEFDKAPSKVLTHHWPDVPNHGDVTKIDWATVEPVDIITGGSPCQDLSHAGKRAGMTEGTRSNLWVQMREAINVIRPQLVIWENVRGAYSATADSALEPCPGCVGGGDGQPALRALGRVLGDLADLGYDCRWYGLRAADAGAAHGRFRVFLFATPSDADVSGLEGLADQAGAAPAGRRGHAESGALGPGLTLLPTPVVNDMGEGKTVEHWDAWTDRMKAAVGNGNGHGKSLAIEAQRLLPTPVSDNSRGLPSASTDYASLANVACALLPTPRATDGTKGGPNQRGSSGDLMLPSAVTLLPTPAHQQAWGQYAAAIARAEQAIGRPAPPPTEIGPKGAPRLSPRFVEFLMMLPEGWVTDVTGLSRNELLKMLGNGVVPAQCAAALRAFLWDAYGIGAAA